MLKITITVSLVGVLIAILSVLAVSHERYIGNAVHKDYPGMCYYNETQTPIPLGEIYYPSTECVKIECRQDYVLRLLYCPRYMLGQGCTVSRDEDARYPDCCPKINCPDRRLIG